MTHVVLTIGGNDTWGGGGIQTDLKTMEHLKVFGICALTCIAVGDSNEHFKIEELPIELLKKQLQTIEEDISLSAIKIGLLSSVEAIEVVTEFIRKQRCPVVLDPVLAFKETQKQLEEGYVQALKQLIPYATLLTPNLEEAYRLACVESPVLTQEELEQLCKKLHNEFHVPVIVKGGHRFQHQEEAIDCYVDHHRTVWFKTDKILSTRTNGAGCCFSSAIASYLAHGESVEEAIQKSKQYVYHAIQTALPLGEAGNVWNRSYCIQGNLHK